MVIAAAMTDVPAGTLTRSPSMTSVTILSARRIGVPVSISLMSAMRLSYSAARRRPPGFSKSSGKCVNALTTGIGVNPPSAHSDPSVIT